MKTRLNTQLAGVVVCAMTAVAAGSALAQEQDMSAPKTRAQVQAELLEAQRTGDILAYGNSSKKLNELYPGRYPAKPAAPGLARAEVKADLLAAQREGEVMALGDSGKKLNELYPSRYPARTAASGVTRAEVKADLLAAQRRGDLIMDDSGTKPNALYPRRFTGR